MILISTNKDNYKYVKQNKNNKVSPNGSRRLFKLKIRQSEC